MIELQNTMYMINRREIDEKEVSLSFTGNSVYRLFDPKFLSSFSYTYAKVKASGRLVKVAHRISPIRLCPYLKACTLALVDNGRPASFVQNI